MSGLFDEIAINVYRRFWRRAFSVLEDDKPSEKPVLERKREWSHGDGGQEACGRRSKPIYTDPNRIPGTCRDWRCDNDEWIGKGIVIRDKAKKTIIHREKPNVP